MQKYEEQQARLARRLREMGLYPGVTEVPIPDDEEKRDALIGKFIKSFGHSAGISRETVQVHVTRYMLKTESGVEYITESRAIQILTKAGIEAMKQE
jgi:hypothetical protein